MSYENQEFGSRPRRTRYDSYGSPPIRGRPNEFSPEERSRRLVYRSEVRPRYREFEDFHDRRPPQRREYMERRVGGSNYMGDPSSRRPQPARPCKVLGVFGLSVHTSERDLYDIFSSYGRVRDIHMVYDNLTGRSRGFAFVYFETTADARNAKASCDGGLDIDGKIARVDYSLTTAPHKPTPGIYLGKIRTTDEDRRSGGTYVRPPRSIYPDDGSCVRYPPRYENQHYGMGGSNGYPPNSRRVPLRDRSPMRHPRHAQRSSGVRRHTVSSSRSRSPPPVFNGNRKLSEESPGSSRKPGPSSDSVKKVDDNWSDAE